MSPLACSAFYPSRLFWCELESLGNIGHRGFYLLLETMELDGTRIVVLKVTKEFNLKNQTARR